MQQEVTYPKLFTSTFALSAFTFGGGYVIVSLMQKKFVEELKWIKEEEMLDLTAIAQSTPGALAINSAIILGYRLKGIKGSLVCLLATILPPFIIISIITYFYESFMAISLIRSFMLGMRCALGAIILDVIINMIVNFVKNKAIKYSMVMIILFVLYQLLDISMYIVIIICALLGIIWERKQQQ